MVNTLSALRCPARGDKGSGPDPLARPLVAYGGYGSDVIRGGAAKDTLNGGPGPDQIWGHGGADQINVADLDAGDVVRGGADTDTCNIDLGIDTR